MKALQEKYYAWIPLVLFCGFYAYKAVGLDIHDFTNYYFGGYLLGEKQFVPEIYFPYWFNQQITGLGYPPAFAGFAPNTPFLAALFYPLTFLSLAWAKLAFNCLSVLLFLYSAVRLANFYSVKTVYVLFLPVFFLVPIRNEILFGQVYFLVFFLLAESWLAYEKKQFPKTALFLSLAISLKIFPALLLALFLFRKQFRLLLYTVSFCAAIICLTAIFCGFDVWMFYFQNVLSKASAGGIASAYVPNYQSVFMFLKHLMVYDAAENPGAFLHFPVLFSLLVSGFKIALLAIGFYVSRKITDSLVVISYWMLAIILVSPYGSTYTFILMLFPFFVLARAEIPKTKKILLFALLLFVTNFPISLFMGHPFPISFLRLFALVGFFGLFLTLVFRAVNWKMVSAASLLAMALLFVFRKETPPQSAYFLDGDAPLLIYDYKVADGRLTYFYWNQNGKNEASIPLRFSRVVPADLSQKDIYYFGKRIPSDSGNKQKPIVIDGKTLLYLSDFDRGIGFYTLRKIDLK